jgi:hypothetical protein
MAGQAGLSFLGEDKAFTAVATLAVTLLLQLQLGCFGDSDDPQDDATHDCEAAWVVANDGDDETDNETAILEQPWCQQHLAALEQQEATP